MSKWNIFTRESRVPPHKDFKVYSLLDDSGSMLGYITKDSFRVDNKPSYTLYGGDAEFATSIGWATDLNKAKKQLVEKLAEEAEGNE